MSPRDPMTPQEMSLRSMRMVHLMLLIAICLYAFTGERVKHRTQAPAAIVLAALTASAAALILGAFFLRIKMVQSARQTLRRKSDDARALGLWRAGTLLSLILCLGVALIGFALRFMGCTLSQVAPFYIVAIVLMLIWTPRLDPPSSGSA